MDGAEWTSSDIGSPQGAVVSPTLANIYLHYTFDLWADRWRRQHARGNVVLVRYADDTVAGFEYETDAKRFLADLRERLEKFALSLHPDKTRLIEFGRFAEICMRLKIFACLLLLPLLTQPIKAEKSAQALPPLRIPFLVSFSYWQNHWFLWMPQHPLYESLEVMSYEDPAHPRQPLVWAFFTERNGAKHQVHYLNDQAVVKSWGGEAYYRPIQYKSSEWSNGARNIDIEFTDKNGKTINFTADFSASLPLTTEHAGLTNQIGHDADSFFLIFFREKHTTSKTLQLLIGGKDYSFQETQATHSIRFHAAYSRNIYVATIGYGHFHVTQNGKTSTISDCEVPRWNDTGRSWGGDESALGARSIVYTDTNGAMREYQALSHGHTFRMEFRPPLQSAPGQVSRYSISLDALSDLVTGSVTTRQQGDEFVYQWRPEAPDWAAAIRYRSVLEPVQHGYAVDVNRKSS
jgi:Reverse transcriptase (RNA-dependent DNA polymerase)